MTNFEKYKDEILNYRDNEGQFCTDFIEPKILKSYKRVCSTTGCAHCYLLTTIWLEDEYKEPKSDWNKVPVDAKIYVKTFDGETWGLRHFAKYENGKVYAWSGGGTSWSCEENEIMHWEYAKLVDT